MFSVRPELQSEWDWERNELSPMELFISSPRRVWWKCKNGHSWEMSPNGRRRGEGCPSCSPGGFSPDRPSIVYALENEAKGCYKVGITFQGSSRVEKFEAKGWTRLNTWTFHKGHEAQSLEGQFFAVIRADLLLPPFLAEQDMDGLGGWTETFSSETITSANLLNLIEMIKQDL